jgi:WhiB family redox-sensing transcriptional regulator
MRGLQVNTTLGTIARPGSPISLDINVDAPPWLRGGGALPCWQADPELFFPSQYNRTFEDQIAEAKAVCAGCPMRDVCLQWALERPYLEGIWAGTTPLERRRLRNPRKKAA